MCKIVKLPARYMENETGSYSREAVRYYVRNIWDPNAFTGETESTKSYEARHMPSRVTGLVKAGCPVSIETPTIAMSA